MVQIIKEMMKTERGAGGGVGLNLPGLTTGTGGCTLVNTAIGIATGWHSDYWVRKDCISCSVYFYYPINTTTCTLYTGLY